MWVSGNLFLLHIQPFLIFLAMAFYYLDFYYSFLKEKKDWHLLKCYWSDILHRSSLSQKGNCFVGLIALVLSWWVTLLIFFQQSLWLDPVFRLKKCVVGVASGRVQGRPDTKLFNVQDVFFCVLLFCLFRAAPSAYASSQARGRIGAAVADLHHSHRNSGSKLHLQPTLQLTAMPDP